MPAPVFAASSSSLFKYLLGGRVGNGDVTAPFIPSVECCLLSPPPPLLADKGGELEGELCGDVVLGGTLGCVLCGFSLGLSLFGAA